jgi:hypothetical protein
MNRMNSKSMRAIVVGAVALAVCALTPAAHAVTYFSDNFDGENGGSGIYDYNSFANWNVTGGKVDLFGAGGPKDPLSGNGQYVDMIGSSGGASLKSISLALNPGSYVLSFDLGGSNDNSDGTYNYVSVSLDGFINDTLRREAWDPFIGESYNFDVTSNTNARIVFTALGASDHRGALLDNVELVRLGGGSPPPSGPSGSAAIPEPITASLAMMGLVALGANLRRRRMV